MTLFFDPKKFGSLLIFLESVENNHFAVLS